MGTFAEKANADYHLSFADQGKPTSVFCFPLEKNKWKFDVTVFHCAANKQKLPFQLVSFFLYIYIHLETDIFRYIYTCIYI